MGRTYKVNIELQVNGETIPKPSGCSITRDANAVIQANFSFASSFGKFSHFFRNNDCVDVFKDILLVRI